MPISSHSLCQYSETSCLYKDTVSEPSAGERMPKPQCWGGETNQPSKHVYFQQQGSSNLSLSSDSLGWDYKSKGSCFLKHQGFRLQKANMMKSGLAAVFFFLLGLSFCLTIPIPLEDSHEFTEKDLQFAEVWYKIIHLHVPITVNCAVTTVWKLCLLFLFPFLALSQDSLWPPSKPCWYNEEEWKHCGSQTSGNASFFWLGGDRQARWRNIWADAETKMWCPRCGGI